MIPYDKFLYNKYYEVAVPNFLGKKFKKNRRLLHLSQTSIATYFGVSQGTISRIERGEAPPETAWSLLEALIRCEPEESRTPGGPKRVGRLASG
jgi:predicted transcriptional regulator